MSKKHSRPGQPQRRAIIDQKPLVNERLELAGASRTVSLGDQGLATLVAEELKKDAPLTKACAKSGEVLAYAVAVLAQQPGAFGQLGVGGGQHAALAGGHVLGRVEAEAAHPPRT